MKWQTYELYLRNLMAQQLEIPILGQLHFACPQGSSTSLFEEYARTELDIPAELLHMGSGGILQGFNALSAGRNDVLLVFPGAYDLTAELAWNKDWTHLVGMGGPNAGGDWSLPGVSIYTDTTEVAETIDVTGDRCQFLNFQVSNYGNNAANLAALNLDGWGCRFKNVGFAGAMIAAQAAVAAAGSLYIDRLGHFPVFENCIFGHNEWAAFSHASEHQGHLRFVGTSDPKPTNGLFRRCKFLQNAGNATYSHAVYAAGAKSIGRGWIFDTCQFIQYSENHGTEATNVFKANSPQTHSIMLTRCMCQGYTEWQGDDMGDAYFGVDMPDSYIGGGIAINPTAST